MYLIILIDNSDKFRSFLKIGKSFIFIFVSFYVSNFNVSITASGISLRALVRHCVKGGRPKKEVKTFVSAEYCCHRDC